MSIEFGLLYVLLLCMDRFAERSYIWTERERKNEVVGIIHLEQLSELKIHALAGTA